MNTIQTTYTPVLEKQEVKKEVSTSVWKRFIHWTDSQEENRFLWLAVALFGHGCVITIITIIAILLSGNHFILWPFAIGAMTLCVITNLAALPTRVTIPVFLFSVLVDVVIIAICISIGFNINGTYI
jgi:hypothetical protein